MGRELHSNLNIVGIFPLPSTAPYGIRESARRIGTEKEEVVLTEEK